MKYTVYILECSDGSYYVGVTNNIDRRFAEHQNGYSEKSYTHTRRPVKLVYQEHYQYVLDAIAREKQLKGWRRAKKEALINGREEDLPGLSSSTNSSQSRNCSE